MPVARHEDVVLDPHADAEARLKAQQARIEQTRLQSEADVVAPARADMEKRQAEARGKVAETVENGRATAAGGERLGRAARGSPFSVPARPVDRVDDGPAFGEPPQVFDDVGDHRARGRGPRVVRGDDDLRVAPEGRVRGERLLLEDVEDGPLEAAGVEGLEEVGGDDEGAARC